MNVTAYFTLAETESADFAGVTVVVVDVVRATTTIVEALANGAGAVYAMASTEEAVRLAASMGREDAILCGERKGVKVEGFDLGNSPAEFTREAVEGMKLVMSTTNGTRAIAAASGADRVLVCAFTNLHAVARAVAADARLAVLCAGHADTFSADDALCAGHLIRAVDELVESELELNDAALAARTLAGRIEPSRSFLSRTSAGRAVIAIGLGADLDVCADLDRHEIVPVVHDQRITISGG